MPEKIFMLVVAIIDFFKVCVENNSFKSSKNRKYLYIEEEDLKVEAADLLVQIMNKCYTLSPKYIRREYNIVNQDLQGLYTTKGTVLKNNVSGIRHEISSSRKKAYDEMICWGYDLTNRYSNEKIRPRLISPEGASKAVELP